MASSPAGADGVESSYVEVHEGGEDGCGGGA